jgi:hypothetical protein
MNKTYLGKGTTVIAGTTTYSLHILPPAVLIHATRLPLTRQPKKPPPIHYQLNQSARYRTSVVKE